MRKLIASAAVAGFLFASVGATAASAAPRHYIGRLDKVGCHAAWDLHKHGLSGVGIPTATVLADLQVMEVRGTAPYRQDARALLHQIVTHRPWRSADHRLVIACGHHH